MVKLLDQSAIEKYGEFTFGKQKQVKIMSRVIAYDLKSAFGARIHKPDGRIIEVDLSEAIEVADGKKGNENKQYKIAIPGLEPGDVLDYFKYSDEMAEIVDLGAQNFVLCDKYPVLNRRINVITDPQLTVEYKCYNSVADMYRSKTDKGRYTANLHLTGLPAVNFKRFVMEYRQLPFIRFQFLNNIDKRYLSNNSRRGGLFANIGAGKILAELRDYLQEKHINTVATSKSTKIVKDYFLKNHPEATPRETADAAWLALMYHDMTNEESTSGQFERSLAFAEILNKLKLYPEEEIGVGVINPRTDVPINELSAWDEGMFVVRTPDAFYFMKFRPGIAPGEFPGEYYGEKIAAFTGNRKNWNAQTTAEEFTLPARRAVENSIIFRDTVTIADEGKVIVNSSVSFNGGIKPNYEFVTDLQDWTAEVEDFFGIPANKRFKDKTYDPEGMRKDLEEQLKEAGESHYGAKPEKVSNTSVTERGVRPDQTQLTINAELEFSGLTEQLGNDLSLTIGMLTGMPQPVADNERTRLLDVLMPFINQETHSLLVKAPEGYQFDAASVEALARNVNDPTALFAVTPQLSEDGDLLLSTVMRYKLADISLEHWPRLMNVLDQASSFANASVILVKK